MDVLKPGDVYAGHRIVRLLGMGGHAQVWLVLAPDGTPRALKILRGDAPIKPHLEARLAHEGELLAMVDHVHVVRLLGAGVDGSRVWLLLGYVEGPSLREVLEKQGGQLPVAVAVRWIRQACEGLAAVHAVGAVHRDIKPDNILVMSGDVVKVVDFGIVKLPGWGVRTTAEQRVGTIPYMAPEQLGRSEEDEEEDPRSDIYAMGVVLYELLTGKHPMLLGGPANPYQLCARVFRFEPPPLRSLRPDAPGDLEALVARTMAKDPKDRPDSMADLAARLQGVLKPLLAPLRAVARSAIPRPDPRLAATEPGSPPVVGAPPRQADRGTPPPAARWGPHGTAPIALYEGGRPASPPPTLRGTLPLAAHESGRSSPSASSHRAAAMPAPRPGSHVRIAVPAWDAAPLPLRSAREGAPAAPSVRTAIHSLVDTRAVCVALRRPRSRSMARPGDAPALRAHGGAEDRRR